MADMVLGYRSGKVPDVDPELLNRSLAALKEAMDKGLVLACHDISDGGLVLAIAEMAFGSEMGASVEVDGLVTDNDLPFLTALFLVARRSFSPTALLYTSS